ncbi:MAG TPA: hypothetical protein ENJ10_08170 [Caldithrix abyssi]|uniref:PEGA domain-containing protein n=1 Tax=Caldithrix abyssi TaxID=187145 RepID=A0A7V1PV67_CALAY|nr:hypothetical protein [Caldithrix abyssi]
MKKSKLIPYLLVWAALWPISVYGGQHCQLSFNTEGEVWEVLLNDSLTCTSSDTVTLAPGVYILKARPADDYQWPGPFIQDPLKLTAGSKLSYGLFNRNRLRAAGMPGRILFPPPETKPELAPTVFYKKPFFQNGLLATAILSNWGAFYGKRLADRSYERYLHSSRRNDINKYYRQSENYDLLSNVMLGISVTALSAYFWLLMED